MVKMKPSTPDGNSSLSVLALSSRFDGPEAFSMRSALKLFQYSLCRVVLMVDGQRVSAGVQTAFQYSLCRVVLMVLEEEILVVLPSIFQYSLCRVVLMVVTTTLT